MTTGHFLREYWKSTNSTLSKRNHITLQNRVHNQWSTNINSKPTKNCVSICCWICKHIYWWSPIYCIRHPNRISRWKLSENIMDVSIIKENLRPYIHPSLELGFHLNKNGFVGITLYQFSLTGQKRKRVTILEERAMKRTMNMHHSDLL